MTVHPLWKEDGLPDSAWKPAAGLRRQERSAEQDRAAGGDPARDVSLSDGRRARASVAFRRQSKGRRVYAYLRWSIDGKTHERYIGEVDQVSRTANLVQAWGIARDRDLLGAPVGARHRS